MATSPSVRELFDLSGRVALVTGGTGHLGFEMASALAEAGGSVIVTSRSLQRAEESAKKLPRSEHGHRGLQLDYRNENELAEQFQSAVGAFGQIDVLVNNGHEHSAADIASSTSEDFNRQLANGVGYFLLARMVRDQAVQRQAPASVIMLGSMYGLVGSYPGAYEGVTTPSPASYHMLKGGIIHLTRHLAVYWAGDHVRVNAISPGPFPAATAPDELVRRLKTKSPMGRMGAPHELKGAVVFLASDASSYVTGHNLVVDGGWTSW